MPPGLQGGTPGSAEVVHPGCRYAAVASAGPETSAETTLIRAGTLKGPDRPRPAARIDLTCWIPTRTSAPPSRTSWCIGGQPYIAIHRGGTWVVPSTTDLLASAYRYGPWRGTTSVPLRTSLPSAASLGRAYGSPDSPTPPLPRSSTPTPCNLASVWIPYRLLPRGAVQS